jgi:nucleoside-diphosphate-sugar epimerase
MRIVVLGATGNVGTSVVEQLAADSAVHSVVGVARRKPDWQPDKVEWLEADLAQQQLPQSFAGADAVLHLAWAFQPSHRPQTTWQVNAVGTAHVLRAVEQARVPVLVVASSVGAYSPASKDAPVDETWPTHGWPAAAYCREKSYVERLLDHFEATSPWCRVVRLRPCFLFKRTAAPEQRRIFAGPLVPQRLLGRIRLPLVPDLAGLRFQMMHTDDAAAAYVRACHVDARGAFNLAADPVIDASAIAEVFGGRPIRLPTGPVRGLLSAAWHARAVPAPPDLFDYALQMPIMDTSRAQRELDWRPRHTALEALAEFRAGLREDLGFPTRPLEPST